MIVRSEDLEIALRRRRKDQDLIVREASDIPAPFDLLKHHERKIADPLFQRVGPLIRNKYSSEPIPITTEELLDCKRALDRCYGKEEKK
jgi:hypothetical protein